VADKEPAALKCPFCGRLYWQMHVKLGTHAHQLECKTCGARGPLTIPDRVAAIEAWNDRAAEERK
jgi:Lar family restriction alleviation protein